MNYKSDYIPALHDRCSIRLKGYDYSSAGAYFITICTRNRECLFGQVVGAGSKPAQDKIVGADSKPAPPHVELNDYGRIVQDTWDDLPEHIKDIQLDAFCIMPNHIHGIISIIHVDINNGRVWNPIKDGRVWNPIKDGRVWNPPLQGVKSCGLPEMVRQFKTFSSRRINQIRGTQGTPVWQRNYYEHIVRNDNELNGFREYINNNPINWETDDEFVRVGV